MQDLLDHIPLDVLEDSLLNEKQIQLSVLRLDQIHPQMGGNKFFKLKYNLQEAQKLGFDTLLTFGGAYSNHIYATAAAGKHFGFKTIGVIRGEEHLPLNNTLEFATSSGMDLHYISREQYRLKNNQEFTTQLKNQFGEFYLIPEGGSNALAVKGCAEIVSQIAEDWDYICTPCGTGGTLAGLIMSLKSGQKALGFSALRGGSFLYEDVKNLMDIYHTDNQMIIGFSEYWEIFTEYHFGGYAKKKPELLTFIDNFQNTYQIPLEWIYSGKMFYGIFDLIQKDYFPNGSKIIALHTGGVRAN